MNKKNIKFIIADYIQEVYEVTKILYHTLWDDKANHRYSTECLRLNNINIILKTNNYYIGVINE